MKELGGIDHACPAGTGTGSIPSMEVVRKTKVKDSSELAWYVTPVSPGLGREQDCCEF